MSSECHTDEDSHSHDDNGSTDNQRIKRTYHDDGKWDGGYVQLPGTAVPAQPRNKDQLEGSLSEDEISDEEFQRIRQIWNQGPQLRGRQRADKPPRRSDAQTRPTSDSVQADFAGLDDDIHEDSLFQLFSEIDTHNTTVADPISIDVGAATSSPRTSPALVPLSDLDNHTGGVYSYQEALQNGDFSPTNPCMNVESSPLIKYTLDDDASVTPSFVEQYLAMALDDPTQCIREGLDNSHDMDPLAGLDDAHIDSGHQAPHRNRRKYSDPMQVSHRVQAAPGGLPGHTTQYTIVNQADPYKNANTQLESTLYSFHSTFFATLPTENKDGAQSRQTGDDIDPTASQQADLQDYLAESLISLYARCTDPTTAVSPLQHDNLQ